MPGLSLVLRRVEASGARAQGLVAPRAALTVARDRLASRAERYPELRLSLTPDLAILWSVEPCDLPWLEGALWLGAPEARIFTPVGWRFEAGALLRAALLQAAERERGLAPPLLLLPESAAETQAPARLIGLAESASLAAVDWRALGAEDAA